MQFSYLKKLINPPLPIHMEGYMRRVADTLHDDIEAQILVFELSGQIVIWCVLDLILISQAFGDRLRQQLSEVSGMSVDHIMISATHTHSGPQTSDMLTPIEDVNPAYLDHIEKTLETGVKEALEKLTEVSANYQEIDFGHHFYSNRNVEEAYSNQTGYLLRFKNTADEVILDLLNFNCHPTILKEDTLALSTDLIGSLRRHYTEKTGNPLAIYLGEAGDVSTRFKRQGTDFAEVERVGKGLTEFLLVSDWKDIKLDNLELSEINLSIPYNPLEDKDFSENYEKVSALIGDNPDYRFMQNMMSNLLETHIGKLIYTGHLLNLGQVIITFFPGEIVAQLGKNIRSSNDKPVLLAAYTNAFNGYAVNQEDYGKYGETFFSRYPRGVADQFVAKFIAKLEAM